MDAPYDFGQSERELIKALLELKDMRSVPGRLGCSKEDFRHRRSNLYAKLGVKNRTELKSFCLQHGIISIQVSYRNFFTAK